MEARLNQIAFKPFHSFFNLTSSSGYSLLRRVFSHVFQWIADTSIYVEWANRSAGYDRIHAVDLFFKFLSRYQVDHLRRAKKNASRLYISPNFSFLLFLLIMRPKARVDTGLLLSFLRKTGLSFPESLGELTPLAEYFVTEIRSKAKYFQNLLCLLRCNVDMRTTTGSH